MRSQPKSLRVLGLSLILICAGLSAHAAAISHFNIPAQPLADSLRALGSQTNINVLYDPPMVAGYRAPALNSTMSADEALTMLLAGTGLSHKFVNEHTVVLSAEKLSSANAAPGGVMQLARADTPSVETPNAAANPDNKAMIEEIVVTAQKRAERAIDVPMSITAISGEELVKIGTTNFLDLARKVPSLAVWESGPGRQQVMIRGLSTSRGSSSLTGIYLDEMPLSGAQNGSVATYADLRVIDLNRVEVLKGPQGTLFGEGAAGGVIRFITNDPDLRRVGGDVSAQFSNTTDGGGNERVSGVLNVPLKEDVFGIRLAGVYEDASGWIDQPSPAAKISTTAN